MNAIFVSGPASTQENFVAVSRLLDITGILNGLDVTYDNIKPVVTQTNPVLSCQIDTGLDTLVVLQGVAAGIWGIVVVGFITFKLQQTLPYKKMLVTTGILIAGVLLVMVGDFYLEFGNSINNISLIGFAQLVIKW